MSSVALISRALRPRTALEPRIRAVPPAAVARVVIGHRQQLSRCALRALVEREGGLEVIAEASSARRALELAGASDACLAIVDAVDFEGLAALEVPVLVVTGRVDRPHVLAALRAGVRGYVTTDASGEAMLGAVRQILAGQRYLSPSISTGMLGELVAQRNDGAGDAQGVALSTREIEVLRLVSEGQGNREIADALHISVHTVDSHRRNVMAKLGVRSVVELVRVAIREGLVSLDG